MGGTGLINFFGGVGTGEVWLSLSSLSLTARSTTAGVAVEFCAGHLSADPLSGFFGLAVDPLSGFFGLAANLLAAGICLDERPNAVSKKVLLLAVRSMIPADGEAGSVRRTGDITVPPTNP